MLYAVTIRLSSVIVSLILYDKNVSSVFWSPVFWYSSFILSYIWCSIIWRMPHSWQGHGPQVPIPLSRRSLSLPRNNPQYATIHRMPQLSRLTNLSRLQVAANAPGIWHTTCKMEIDDFPYDQIRRMVPPRSGLINGANTRWAVAPGLIWPSAHLVPGLLLANYVYFDHFFLNFSLAGPIRILMVEISG